MIAQETKYHVYRFLQVYHNFTGVPGTYIEVMGNFEPPCDEKSNIYVYLGDKLVYRSRKLNKYLNIKSLLRDVNTAVFMLQALNTINGYADRETKERAFRTFDLIATSGHTEVT